MTSTARATGIPPIAAYDLPRPTELPTNVVAWEPDPRRAVLLVHDMQRYFLAPFEPTFRRSLIETCAHLRDRSEALGVPTRYTAQPGGMTEQERGLLRDFWGPGMRVDPIDREIVEELTPRTEGAVMTKWRYSAFFRSDLLEQMRAQGRDQLIICGVYAHVGVLMTALEAFSNDIQPFVVADALGDFTAEHHEMTLTYAAGRCAKVVTAEELFQ